MRRDAGGGWDRVKRGIALSTTQRCLAARAKKKDRRADLEKRALPIAAGKLGRLLYLGLRGTYRY